MTITDDDRVLAVICLNVEMGHGVPQPTRIAIELGMQGLEVQYAIRNLIARSMLTRGFGRRVSALRLTNIGWQWARENQHLLTLAGLGDLKRVARKETQHVG